MRTSAATESASYGLSYVVYRVVVVRVVVDPLVVDRATLSPASEGREVVIIINSNQATKRAWTFIRPFWTHNSSPVDRNVLVRRRGKFPWIMNRALWNRASETNER